MAASASSATAISEIALFEDNYCWRLDVAATGSTVCVDPADGPAVLARLEATPALALKGVLTTHHHPDHSGGNEALAAALPGLPILGGAGEAPRSARTRRAACGRSKR
jgi:hydroxyacylglutathione hydrolase